MTIPADKSFELADETLQNIKEHAASASPMSYELWFTHIAGLNPKLSTELEKAIESDQTLTDAATQLLHDRHFANELHAKEVLVATEGVSSQVERVIERIVSAGDDYKSFSGSLETAMSSLETVEEKTELSSLITVLADATSAITKRNADLEGQLQVAQSELTSLRDDVHKIREEAYTDGLTGIANRKRFDREMEKTLLALEEEDAEPACLILGDVDHFKSFNDKWGHQVGDQVLKLVASGLSANTKGQDLVARYGGEEFAIIVPNTTLEDAMMLSDKLRGEIAKRRLTKRSTNEVIGHVTISFGVARICKDDSATEVIERADRCLYKAKENGRNCVIGEESL
ncbi:MAG: GGDEF domain-containing protein [Pseudomonadota bacterium]